MCLPKEGQHLGAWKGGQVRTPSPTIAPAQKRP